MKKYVYLLKYIITNIIKLYLYIFSYNFSAFKKSIVDDEFFKLSEMENFLLSEEKLETTKDKPKRLEDDIDMFQDLQSDNEVKIY